MEGHLSLNLQSILFSGLVGLILCRRKNLSLRRRSNAEVVVAGLQTRAFSSPSSRIGESGYGGAPGSPLVYEPGSCSLARQHRTSPLPFSAAYWNLSLNNGTAPSSAASFPSRAAFTCTLPHSVHACASRYFCT